MNDHRKQEHRQNGKAPFIAHCAAFNVTLVEYRMVEEQKRNEYCRAAENTEQPLEYKLAYNTDAVMPDKAYPDKQREREERDRNHLISYRRRV